MASSPGAVEGGEFAPPPGSPEELRTFASLQKKLAPLYRRLFTDAKLQRTVVVLPSLSFDPAELRKISGVLHYEERLLCLLMLLHMPRTEVVYVTSNPLDSSIVDYYLHLLPGVPTGHALRRLTLVSCNDSSLRSLTEKVLANRHVVEEIRSAIANPEDSHLTCFNATDAERTLAVQLGIPMYACDPALTHLGNKSFGRELLREAGVPVPDGFEHVESRDQLVETLATLKARNPTLERAVVKLNDGFSGEGNALFSYEGAPEQNRSTWIDTNLVSKLRFEAGEEAWDSFEEKLGRMGGITEEFLVGASKTSPSVQLRIDPLGKGEIVSTHDQVMGGPTGQVYLGCTFPADPAYRSELHTMGMQVSDVLTTHGVIGRLAVDFISTKKHGRWQHHAIEINLRKGGTTLPFLMLQFLTDGVYDSKTGLYRTPTGQTRYYYATDNLQKHVYRGITPERMVDVAVFRDLHWNPPAQQGVVFHMLGALPDFGKLGIVSIGTQPESARAQYDSTVQAIDEEISGAP